MSWCHGEISFPHLGAADPGGRQTYRVANQAYGCGNMLELWGYEEDKQQPMHSWGNIKDDCFLQKVEFLLGKSEFTIWSEEENMTCDYNIKLNGIASNLCIYSHTASALTFYPPTQTIREAWFLSYNKYTCLCLCLTSKTAAVTDTLNLDPIHTYIMGV